MQREAPGAGETIERASVSMTRNRHVILTLIQKDTCLLTFDQIGFQLESVHRNGDRTIQFALDQFDFARQLFERAYRRIVPQHDGARRKLCIKRGDDFGGCAVHPLIERLDDEAIGIAVDNERRQEIRFRVNEAIGGRIPDYLFAETLGGGNAARLGTTASGVRVNIRRAI